MRLLHTESSVLISVGSDLTAPIIVRTGIKQGDPVASALYCLGIEPLLFRLHKKLCISGPSAWRKHPDKYLSAYADDTNALLGHPSQITIIETEYKKYSQFSSSKLNTQKSVILLLGGQLPPVTRFPVVSDGIKILGIYFGNNSYTAQNFIILMDKFRSKLDFYTKKCAPVSHISRSKIINTFLLPIFWYLFKILDPPVEILEEICKEIEKYIWSGSKRWVARPFVYLPLLNGGLGVRNPAAQIATFRLTFLNKILAISCEQYFHSESLNQVHKVINSDINNLTPFYKQLYAVTQTLGVGLTSCCRDLLREMMISSKFLFRNLSDNYISRCNIIKVCDLFSLRHIKALESLPASSKRHAFSERKKYIDIGAMVTDSIETKFDCFSIFDKSVRVMVAKQTNYLHCLRVFQKIRWVEPNMAFCSHKKWSRLATTAVTNPEKDTVFKFWHNVGLTPSMAFSLKIYDNYLCPFCNMSKPKVAHYLECPYTLNLRKIVAKFLFKIGIDTRAFDEAFLHGVSHAGGNILIFYAYNIIYKAFIHKLNKYSGEFDQISSYRHILYGRILTDFYACSLNASLLPKFHTNWNRFDIYKISNNKINIKLGF